MKAVLYFKTCSQLKSLIFGNQKPFILSYSLTRPWLTHQVGLWLTEAMFNWCMSVWHHSCHYDVIWICGTETYGHWVWCCHYSINIGVIAFHFVSRDSSHQAFIKTSHQASYSGVLYSWKWSLAHELGSHEWLTLVGLYCHQYWYICTAITFSWLLLWKNGSFLVF